MAHRAASRTPLKPGSPPSTPATPSSPSALHSSLPLSLPAPPPSFLFTPHGDPNSSPHPSLPDIRAAPPDPVLPDTSPLFPALSSPPVLLTPISSSSAALHDPRVAALARSESVRAQTDDEDVIAEQSSAARVHSHLSISTRASSSSSHHLPSASPIPITSPSPPAVPSPALSPYGSGGKRGYRRGQQDASDEGLSPASSAASSTSRSRSSPQPHGQLSAPPAGVPVGAAVALCPMCDAPAEWWCRRCETFFCQRDLDQRHASLYPVGHQLVDLRPRAGRNARRSGKAVEEEKSAAFLSAEDSRQREQQQLVSAVGSSAASSGGGRALDAEVHHALQQISQQRTVEGLKAVRSPARNGRGGRGGGGTALVSAMDTPSIHHRFLPVLNKADLQQHWESLLEDVTRLYPKPGRRPSFPGRPQPSHAESPSRTPRVRVTPSAEGPMDLGHLLPIASRMGGRSVSAISPNSRQTVLARLTSTHSPIASPLRWRAERADNDGESSRGDDERTAHSSGGHEELSSASGGGEGNGSARSSEEVREEDGYGSSSGSSSSRHPHRFYHSTGERSVDDAAVSVASSQRESSAHSSAHFRRSLSSVQLTSLFAIELPSATTAFLHRSQSSPPRELAGVDGSRAMDGSHQAIAAGDWLAEVDEEDVEGGGDDLPSPPAPLRSVQFREGEDGEDYTDDEDAHDSTDVRDDFDSAVDGSEHVPGAAEEERRVVRSEDVRRWERTQDLSQTSRSPASSFQSYEHVDDRRHRDRRDCETQTEECRIHDSDAHERGRRRAAAGQQAPYARGGHQDGSEGDGSEVYHSAIDSRSSSGGEHSPRFHPSPPRSDSQSSSDQHPTPLAAVFHAQRRAVSETTDGAPRPSASSRGAPFPFEDADLNDAVWIEDDDDVERERSRQQQPPRTHRSPLHRHKAPYHTLITAFHRVLDHLGDAVPPSADPVEEDVRLVARVLQRLLDGPSGQSHLSESQPDLSSLTASHERNGYEGRSVQHGSSPSGGHSSTAVSSAAHSHSLFAPPALPIASRMHANSGKTAFAGHHSPENESAASATPIASAPAPRTRHHRPSSAGRQPPHYHPADEPFTSSGFTPTPLNTPKAPSLAVESHRRRDGFGASGFSPSIASHGRLPLLPREAHCRAVTWDEPGVEAPRVTVTGPGAITVRLRGVTHASHSHRPSYSAGNMQTKEEHSRRRRDHGEEPVVKEHRAPETSHRQRTARVQ